MTSAVIHGLVHASVLMLPPLIGDFKRAFAVSHLQVLGVFNVVYLVYGLAAVPAGYLADRYGSRLMLVLAGIGCTGALLLVSSAPSFTLLAAGLVLLGLAAGMYHPSGLSLLSRGVASGERGRALGIHGAGGNWGEVVAPVWATYFAEHHGWRWGFIAAAALSAACALLALTLPVEARPAHAAPPGGFAGLLRGLAVTVQGYWRNRPLRWVLVALIGAGFAYRGFYTFLGMHLQDSVGGERRAWYVMFGVLLAGVFGQRYGGSLADRVPRERLFLALAASAAPLLLLVSLSSGPTLLVASLLYSLVWSAAQPVANALTAAYADARNHGFLYGVQFALTFGLGSFATSGGGLLQSLGGTTLAYAGFAVVAALEFLAVLALVRTIRAAQRTAPC
jgi:predicted MFS family arabinose efflux permease